jgi:hypothetical protein
VIRKSFAALRNLIMMKFVFLFCSEKCSGSGIFYKEMSKLNPNPMFSIQVESESKKTRSNPHHCQQA